MIALIGVIFLIISALLFLAGWQDQGTPLPVVLAGLSLLFGIVCLLGDAESRQKAKSGHDNPTFVGTAYFYQRPDGSIFIKVNK